MEIDYSGDLLTWVDEEGEINKAHIFVACFPYSGYLFAYATKDEKAESWIEGTVRALNFASGSPKILVVDNARALVSKASKEEGTVTSLVQDLCDHYGMTPWSCKPYSPKEKNRVEASVKMVQTWLQGALELQGLIYAKDFDALNEKIKIKVCEINRKPLSDPALKTCREKRFLEEEFPFLTPLPETEYEVCKWLALTVDKSHCVKIHCDNGHRYSVPAAYLHKIVHVRLTKDEVIIFDRDTHKKLGVHLRCYNSRGQKTHILESHLTDKEKNRRREPQYFIDTFVRKGIPEDVARHYVEQSWKKSGDFLCRQRLHAITHNLLNLGEKRSELLTEALTDAVEFDQFSYKFLKELLEKKIQLSRHQTNFEFDLQTEEDEEYCTPTHENVRKYE